MIASQQKASTHAAKKLVLMILDYVSTYPNDGIRYRKSGMKIAAHAKTGYLKVTNTHSRAGAHIFLS